MKLEDQPAMQQTKRKILEMLLEIQLQMQESSQARWIWFILLQEMSRELLLMLQIQSRF